MLLGVGIDGGNGKEWESNAKSIQLIKQRGKVKALDEEIHSKLRWSFLTWQESVINNSSLDFIVYCSNAAGMLNIVSVGLCLFDL